jgi:hypothetical protein
MLRAHNRRQRSRWDGERKPEDQHEVEQLHRRTSVAQFQATDKKREAKRATPA